MKVESVAFALSGTLFGVIVGWIIGSQNSRRPPENPPVAAATPAAAPAGSAFDSAKAARLEQQAAAEPTNSAVRIELANLYFDAERFDQAVPWYESALKLDPSNVNVSTDLGVAYYSLNQFDRALAQFDTSLRIDPKHLKTLLNQGIVRAIGKRDLGGAKESWEKVVELAPNSEEGRRAAEGLEGLRAVAHQAVTSDGRAAGPAPNSGNPTP